MTNSRHRALTRSESEDVRQLRTLAETGHLAEAAATATGDDYTAIVGAAFAIAWPVVFDRWTSALERRRGHIACATSLFRMPEECLDRFYDDTEAVIEDLLNYCRIPIHNLEGWIASRLNAATVDGHRRRRGRIGALQRPRVPIWLSTALKNDPWLVDLATQILIWVGVTATAGFDIWPLDAWTGRRAAIVDTPAESPHLPVIRDIETVLTAMRTRPAWYDDYVERPLGHKRPPVAGRPDAADSSPVLLADESDQVETLLHGLAADALTAISARIRRGEPANQVVREVLAIAFGSADDHAAPLGGMPNCDEYVADILGDPRRSGHVVAEVIRIVDEQ